MNTTNFEHILDFPIDNVWELLSDFPRLDWLRADHELEVVGSGSPGTVRIIKMKERDPVWEVLLASDSDTKTVSYAVPLGLAVPVSSYSATMHLESMDEGKTKLNWQSAWEADSHEIAEAAELQLLAIYAILASGIETVLINSEQR